MPLRVVAERAPATEREALLTGLRNPRTCGPWLTASSRARSTIALAGPGCSARARRVSLLPAAEQLPEHALRARPAKRRGLASSAEHDALARRLTSSTQPEALARRARQLGLVRPGERLFIVKGIDAWRARESQHASARERWMTARSSSASLAAAARVPARRRPLSVRRAGRNRQSPYDSAGEPFPTTFYLTCRHLVAAARGWRPPAASSAGASAVGDDPSSRASLDAATAEQRASAASSRTAGSGATAARRSTSASAARQSAAAEVPARPRRVRARPPRIRARRTDLRASSSRSGPPRAAPA